MDKKQVVKYAGIFAVLFYGLISPALWVFNFTSKELTIDFTILLLSCLLLAYQKRPVYVVLIALAFLNMMHEMFIIFADEITYSLTGIFLLTTIYYIVKWRHHFFGGFRQGT